MPQEPSKRRVRWPNYAKFYRDDAAKRSIDVIQELEPIVEGRVQDPQKILARVNRAYVAAQKALLRLLSAGADVEPP